MGSMSKTATLTSPEIWSNIDDRLRRGDEDRWLSSRYAARAERQALIALYALAYELARVRLVVSEPGLGAIRFQWWRDALDELASGKKPRAHDVVGALADTLVEGHFPIEALQTLVDQYQDAYDASDRASEPEAHLALTAAGVLAPDHGWHEHIKMLAPQFAALRRREDVGQGPAVPCVPTAIRPAVGHFRLRRLYANQPEAGRLARRASVFRAVLGGRV